MSKEIEALRLDRGSAIEPGQHVDRALRRAAERIKAKMTGSEALAMLCHVADIPTEHAAPHVKAARIPIDDAGMLQFLEALGESPGTPAHAGFCRAAPHLRPALNARAITAMIADFIGI